jgi:Protein of unknown function (DUF3298)
MRKSVGSIQLEEAFRQGDFVSIRFLIYQDVTGAAHAGWWTKTKNFFGPRLGKLDITDLFASNLDALRYITNYVVLDLHRQTNGTQSWIETEHSMESWQETRELWALYSQFSFDAENLTIMFSPAEVYAWACGDFTVRIPWAALTGFLDLRIRGSNR